nr:MAG TPA: Carcinustatin peptide [Caudoviricetes sp.]DAQ91202.1 MAG TPA: Carcinustatin peptide [Caudoviricetes sp.]DAU89755.1 MAG TPA: Carcinustatin peptide [Caudoviricetes sp.]
MPARVGRNQTILWHIILLNRTIHNITEHSKAPYSYGLMSAVAAKFLR